MSAVLVPLVIVAVVALAFTQRVHEHRARRGRGRVGESSRAVRDRQVNLVLNLPDWRICERLSRLNADCADLQGLADLVAGVADDEPRHTR